MNSRTPRSFSSAAMRLETACWVIDSVGGGFLELAGVRGGDEGAHGVEVHANRP